MWSYCYFGIQPLHSKLYPECRTDLGLKNSAVTFLFEGNHDRNDAVLRVIKSQSWRFYRLDPLFLAIPIFLRISKKKTKSVQWGLNQQRINLCRISFFLKSGRNSVYGMGYLMVQLMRRHFCLTIASLLSLKIGWTHFWSDQLKKSKAASMSM